MIKSVENSGSAVQPNPRRPGQPSWHDVFLPSQHSGRPQSTVRVTKNDVPDNHPKRVWVALKCWPYFFSSMANTIPPLGCPSVAPPKSTCLQCGSEQGSHGAWPQWYCDQIYCRPKASPGYGGAFGILKNCVFVGWGRKDADIGTKLGWARRSDGAVVAERRQILKLPINMTRRGWGEWCWDEDDYASVVSRVLKRTDVISAYGCVWK